MFRPVSLFIGWRYVRAVQAEKIITLYALISIIGLALGVAVLIVVLSILNGFESEFKQRILGLVSPVKIYSRSDWATWEDDVSKLIDESHLSDQVKAYAPFIEMPAMLVNGRRTETIYLAAVDREREALVSPIAEYLNERHGVKERLSDSPEGILLGAQLAKKLAVGEGDSINVLLINPRANQGASGLSGVLPKSTVMPVVGVIATRTELDQRLALINLSVAQTLMGYQGVMGVKLRLEQVLEAPYIASVLRTQLMHQSAFGRNHSVIDWTQTHGNLFHAIKLPQTIMWLLLFFILLVAAFNMTTTLYMMVKQKRAELAVMQTFGTRAHQLVGSFLAQGMIVAVLGVAVGTVLGVLIALGLPSAVALFEGVSGHVLFEGDSYFIQFLPVEINVWNIVWVSLAAILISACSVVLPAIKAGRLEPVKALRGDY